jgi:hypothetical protein
MSRIDIKNYKLFDSDSYKVSDYEIGDKIYLINESQIATIVDIDYEKELLSIEYIYDENDNLDNE